MRGDGARPALAWIGHLIQEGGRGEPGIRGIHDLVESTLGAGNSPGNDPDATDEFATLSSLTLLPGQLKLRVGVVSVRGNYREHNEDNYYVPGRRPGPAPTAGIGRAVPASCRRR